MRINYIVGEIGPNYAGGMLCIYEYINGLIEKGNDVTVVPLRYLGMPAGFELKGEVILNMKRRDKLRGSVISLLKKTLSRNTISWLNKVMIPSEKGNRYIYDRFAQLANVIGRIPDCEVNIATSFETALAVYYSGKGVPFYFMQHFEEYFCNEFSNPEFARKDAALSYMLPLNKIANCTWLKQEVEKYYPYAKVIGVVNNAIRTEVFYPRKVEKDTSKITIVSYGGRNAVWKGFNKAALAIKKIREKYPDVEWLVYGSSMLPPNNDIAKYRHIGYVTGETLANIYSMGDIMICPSWYESFPLFPLEAMACGLAVVTTPYGTEDYAENENNCLICQPKDPEGIARAVIRLIENETLRKKLSVNGIKTAKHFTWQRSVCNLENLLKKYASNP